MALNITGMMAIANGEPCMLCLKDNRRIKDVFISKPTNDIFAHLVKEHPKDFVDAMGFNDEK